MKLIKINKYYINTKYITNIEPIQTRTDNKDLFCCYFFYINLAHSQPILCEFYGPDINKAHEKAKETRKKIVKGFSNTPPTFTPHPNNAFLINKLKTYE